MLMLFPSKLGWRLTGKEQQEQWRRGASSCPRGKAEKAQPLLLQTSRTTLPLVRVNFSQPCHDEIGLISMRSIQVFAGLFAEIFAALFRGMVALS